MTSDIGNSGQTRTNSLALSVNPAVVVQNRPRPSDSGAATSRDFLPSGAKADPALCFRWATVAEGPLRQLLPDGDGRIPAAISASAGSRASHYAAGAVAARRPMPRGRRCPVAAAATGARSGISAARQTQHTNDDQIDRNDIVEQRRTHQNQNAGSQGDDRLDHAGIHDNLPSVVYASKANFGAHHRQQSEAAPVRQSRLHQATSTHVTQFGRPGLTVCAYSQRHSCRSL